MLFIIDGTQTEKNSIDYFVSLKDSLNFDLYIKTRISVNP